MNGVEWTWRHIDCGAARYVDRLVANDHGALASEKVIHLLSITVFVAAGATSRVDNGVASHNAPRDAIILIDQNEIVA